MAIDELDVTGIFADDQRRQARNHIAQARAAEAFVVLRLADEAFVSHHLQEREHAPACVAAQGFDAGNFHGPLLWANEYRDAGAAQRSTERTGGAQLFYLLRYGPEPVFDHGAGV